MRRARATMRFSLNLYLAISILPVVIVPDVGKFRVQKVNSITWALGQHSGRNVERGIPPSWMILIVVRSHVQPVADPIIVSDHHPERRDPLGFQHHVHHRDIRRDRVATGAHLASHLLHMSMVIPEARRAGFVWPEKLQPPSALALWSYVPWHVSGHCMHLRWSCFKPGVVRTTGDLNSRILKVSSKYDSQRRDLWGSKMFEDPILQFDSNGIQYIISIHLTETLTGKNQKIEHLHLCQGSNKPVWLNACSTFCWCLLCSSPKTAAWRFKSANVSCHKVRLTSMQQPFLMNHEISYNIPTSVSLSWKQSNKIQ